MKTIKSLVLTIIALTTILTSSCATSVRTNGNVVTKELNDVSFQKLNICSFFTVKFTQAKQYKVKVTISERFEPYLISKVENGELVIAIDSRSRGLNVDEEDMALVEISAPSFRDLELSGAVTMTLEGSWKLEEVSLDLSGASRLTAETLLVEDLTIEQSGASRINAVLSVDQLDVENSGASQLTLKSLDQKCGHCATIEVSGASHVNLGKYPFKKVVVDASGASHAKVFPTQRLKAEASGASSIRYVDASKELRKELDKSGIASISAD